MSRKTDRLRIAVIGRSGQVAQSLVERGDARGHEIIAGGRPEVDLTDAASLDRFLSAHAADAVVNAAAYTAVDQAEDEEEAASLLNAAGPGVLARLCRERNLPFVHLSTDYVFDGSLDRPYRETDPIAPRSAYGRTKADGERAIMESGADALILRTAWVYSPFGKNFVATMLRVGASRPKLTVVDDQWGNPTSALDIADAILTLLEVRDAWPKGAHIYHLAATDEASWHSFASAIFAASPYSPEVLPTKTADYRSANPSVKAARPSNSRLDCDALARDFGVRLPSWKTSLVEVVDRHSTTTKNDN